MQAMTGHECLLDPQGTEPAARRNCVGRQRQLRVIEDAISGAGEMLDWDAPTGSYLLTACFASGSAAGMGVLSVLGL